MDYCRTCYRNLPEEGARCFSCDVATRREAGRRAGLGGVIGVPLLIAGMLGFNPRLCFVAAIVSAIAAIFYTIRALTARA